MKKFKLLAFAVLIGTASTFAMNPEPTPKKEIRSQIVELLEAPTFSVDKTVEVNLSFTFSSEGEIIVLNVDSKNSEVLNYVRENINHKKIENPGKRDKLYTMPLTLKSK